MSKADVIEIEGVVVERTQIPLMQLHISEP